MIINGDSLNELKNLEAEYAEIARARVEHAKTEDDTNKQLQLIE